VWRSETIKRTHWVKDQIVSAAEADEDNLDVYATGAAFAANLAEMIVLWTIEM
jgi:phosphoribosylcarboxyaminoimidazole (NCAIR) mutase